MSSSPSGVPAGAPNRRQKRMGPAPFASFEDLSDELDSPEDKATSGSVVRLPGIREDITPLSPAVQNQFVYTGISLIGAPSTPTMATAKSMLETPAAPRIDISRASSSSHHDSKDSSPERELMKDQGKGLGFREEGTLDLRSSTEELDFQIKVRPHSPALQEDSYHSHHRKDSQSSEVGLLCISGRTSRLSSIGSQGSAHSRVSNASHLSVISGQSGVSRSPSPHKMLLETSFCGTKPQKNKEVRGESKDELERVLLKRKHDPTKAMLCEGIVVKVEEAPPTKIELPKRPEITIKVDKPTQDKPKIPKHIISDSGTEYIYIPLRGPLPEDNSNGKTKVRETKSVTIPTSPKEVLSTSKSKSASPSPVVSRHQNLCNDPKYIRIKLKPDHLYDDFDKIEFQKPDTLDFNNPKKPAQTFEQILAYQPTPTASPKHLTPSPSLSRKSSFASLFKSRETISPESPTTNTSRRKNTLTGLGEKLKERRRSRSKSRERSAGPSSSESIDSKGRQKSMFSLFKTKKTSQNSSPDLPNLEGLVNVECKSMPKKKYYETQLEGDSVRIPLHSPTYYEQKNILQEFKSSSQDSQETVIEVPQKQTDEKKKDFRQSSTSSENIVFSTRLGSSNELFSTKLPKDKNSEVTTAIVETIKYEEEEETKVLVEKKRSTPIEQKKEIPAEFQNAFEPTTIIQPIKKESPIISNDISIKPNVKLDEFDVPMFETQFNMEKRQQSIDELKLSKAVGLKLQKQKSITPPEAVVTERTPDFEIHVQIRKAAKPEVIQMVTKEDEIGLAKMEERQVRDELEDEEGYSSESERDSEVDKKEIAEAIEPERKGLVLQQDSFEDELPYIPTTLPQERSVAVPIIPVKQRNTFEMKTCPIDRPRSTTPINPTCLEDYCEEVIGNINTENITKTIEKLKICLPREDSCDKPKDRSPRKVSTGNWFDFGKTKKTPEEAPPLPPKAGIVQKEWINFEEIPEKRKPPKRIQTIPSRGQIEVPKNVLQENVIYTYVNPEDCKCECHERTQHPTNEEPVMEDEVPLIEDDTNDDDKTGATIDKVKLDVTILDRRSIVSDSSVDLSANIDHADANGIDHSLRTPFTSDLGISSNRSSIISQDDAQSPDTDSPNAFPKT
ncbi:PREDICTED: uncharacterized protein LOC108557583 [Nicrophorus vespilloides]|uniref:Uncharacterized protein LOC108557583 n=1 Tax=Nicrophorus vespilloides TaxID=110193 RepID=A0ABM1M508_NICVS|nr:PREDICTED: uncharacterized protein LOC108557583 [Nicrophorus vespilloides]